MINCDRIFVEGNSDKMLLNQIITNYIEIEASEGKSNVVNRFKNIKTISQSLQEGNICFIIDGDEEGYSKIFEKLNEEITDLTRDPPYIKKCVGDLCYVLVIIGDENDDYRGCLESMLIEELSSKIDTNAEKIINDMIKYKTRQGSLTLCDVHKMRFYLSVFLLSDDPAILYLTKNFITQLFSILDKNKIKNIYRKFIDIE